MKHPLPLKIVGVGRYLPDRVVPNLEVEEALGLPPGAIDLTQAGVKERRRRCREEETSSYICAQAAREALDDAGLSVDDIDLIINGSGTQEQAVPDTAPLIQRQLGIEDSGITAFSLHSTCLSFLVSLNVAANYLATGQHRNILITSGDLASVGIDPGDPESFVLFGDGAAAAVVTRPAPGETSAMTGYVFRTFGKGAYHLTIMGGGSRFHPNSPETTPAHNLFKMEGKMAYLLSKKHTAETLEALRPGLSSDLGSIKAVVPHQASGLAIKALTRMGWPAERIMVTIDMLGNCISASLPLTLYKTIREGHIRRGDEMLLMGTGAGMSIGAATLVF